MNTRQIDLNASIEEAREMVDDYQGTVAASTYVNDQGKTRVTVTFSITVDAVEKKND